MASAGRGTDHVLEKLRDSVVQGRYYEAHQMYRTVCRRYLKQKKYAKAIELLYSGALILLEHKQIGSSTDLSLYLIDAYTEGQVGVNDESRERILKILNLFPPEAPGCKRFMDAAVGWSVKFGDNPNGDPLLHHRMAVVLWKARRYADAEPHFLAGVPHESSAAYGRMLAEWSALDNDASKKRGVYIARAVLQYLGLRSIRDARNAFDVFVAEVGKSQLTEDTAPYHPTPTAEPLPVPVYTLPLLNFLSLLVLTVQRDAAELFMQLRARYKADLAIEPSFGELLNRIGEVFFNIRQERPQQFNIFNDLMNSLFTPGVGGAAPGIGAGAGVARGASTRSSSQDLD